MAAAGATFNCSVCDTKKLFNHPSWRTRKGTDTFCTSCRKVQYHKNPNVEAHAPAATQPAVPAAAQPAQPTQPAQPVAAPASAVLPVVQQPPPGQPGAGVPASQPPFGGAPLSVLLQPGQPQPAAPVVPAVAAPVEPVPAVPEPVVEEDPVPTPPEPVTYAELTTSVTGLQDDDVLRDTQGLMEKEIQQMDDVLKVLRSHVPDERQKDFDNALQQLRSPESERTDPPKEKEKEKEKPKEKEKEKPAAVEPNIPYPELGMRVDASLWPALTERLAACGLSEADVATCTPLTFEKVLLYLAFNPLERARLLQEFTAKYGTNAVSAAPKVEEDPKPDVRPMLTDETPSEVDFRATPLDILGPPTGATLPYANQIAYETETNLKNEPLLIDPSQLHRWPNWKGPGWVSNPSAQPASESNFDEEGFEPLLKCAAHPERPVEFWCVNCESLVCSLCHITGFHKDHPFMPLAESARKECAGLQDWQMRAGTVSGKLDDSKLTLEEVHQNIDDYHQQQIDNCVSSIDQLKAELDGHKDSMVKRIQGHAAAQHQLFNAPDERIKQLKHSLSKVANKIDSYVSANPDSMTPEDSQRWAQGIMNVRSTIANAFADAANHPIVIPNYTNLKYTNDVTTDDLYAKLFLVKAPAPIAMASYLEMRELQHPLFSAKDRLNFTWAQPFNGGGQDTATLGPPDAHPTGELQGNSPIVLNNNNLTATYASPGSGHVLFKATVTFEAGKHYWEVRLDSLHNDNMLGTHAIVGLVEEGSESMGSQTGLAWCVDKLSGVVPMALECPQWTPGSLVGIFLDLDMDRVGLYFNKQCIAHVAIPHGRYTPAASVHCSADQVTLIPQADIPAGVSLTSGLGGRDTAYRLTVPGQGVVQQGIAPMNLSVIDPIPDQEVSYLQEECLKLRQHVSDVKRDIVEQQRVQAQQNFQEQQIKDLKSRIDETAAQMANQTLSFERQAASDLHKLQDFQRKQLEDETKRALQMQAETSVRANEVEEARGRQQEQSGRLERYLVDQQVQLTQHMLDRQRQQENDMQAQSRAAASRDAARAAYNAEQLVRQQSVPPPPESHAAMRLPQAHPAAGLVHSPPFDSTYQKPQYPTYSRQI